MAPTAHTRRRGSGERGATGEGGEVSVCGARDAVLSLVCGVCDTTLLVQLAALCAAPTAIVGRRHIPTRACRAVARGRVGWPPRMCGGGVRTVWTCTVCVVTVWLVCPSRCCVCRLSLDSLESRVTRESCL